MDEVLERREIGVDEWEAWRYLCRELEAVGIYMNHHPKVAAAARLWGERLVALRLNRPEYTEAARASAEAEYDRLVNGNYPDIS